MLRPARIAELRHYVGFGAEDAGLLAAIRDAIAPDFPRIAQGFYDKIREHEEAHAVFTDEDQIARLQQSLQVWMHRLLGGVYDVDYYARTAHIGEVHVRVGLPQRYMFTAMALIRLDLVRLIDERAPPGLAEPTKAALHKAIDLELTVMLEAYRAAHLARAERLQALEKEELTQSLAMTERRYVAAVELTRELVVGVDADCVVRLFNAGAEAATGYGREEVIPGQPFASLLARESHEAFAKAFDERPATGRLSIETVVRTRAGHARQVRWEIVSAKADDNLDTFLTGHDATEERALAERTRQSEKLAAVGTLAAGLAHEIRNPLNGAQLHLSYLARTLGKAEAPADTLEAVGVIGDEIKRLASLVTEFLDFARPKPLTRRTVGLIGLCERTLALGGDHAEGVTLVRDFPPKDIMVDADAAKLEQVLLNVVNNAVEALAPSGGGSVTMRLRRRPRHAVMEVEDNGPGIESREPIFDAFYSTKAQGTGLGLAIAHRIVTDHGGTIEVESRPGRTVFRITLPLSTVEEVE